MLHGAATTHTKGFALRFRPKHGGFQNVTYFGFAKARFITGDGVSDQLGWQCAFNKDHLTALTLGGLLLIGG